MLLSAFSIEHLLTLLDGMACFYMGHLLAREEGLDLRQRPIVGLWVKKPLLVYILLFNVFKILVNEVKHKL